MDKPAITTHHIHPIIKQRWSPRSLSPQSLDKDKLQRIFEAARWAPSGFNEQPWRFIVGIRGDATWQKMYDALVEFNQIWAKNAPVLVVNLGKKTISKNGQANASFQYDVGQSIAYITFQAAAEGLVVHQMGGFNREALKKAFDVPDDYAVLTVCSIATQDSPDKLPPNFEEMERAPRQRRPLEELVYTEAFGKPWPPATEAG